MSSVTIRVPKFLACCRISSISSGPLTPCPECGAMYCRDFGGDRVVEIGVQVAGRKAGIVLHLGGQVQLAQRQRAAMPVGLGDGPLEDQRLQIRPGPRKSRPPSRPARCR